MMQVSTTKKPLPSHFWGKERLRFCSLMCYSTTTFS